MSFLNGGTATAEVSEMLVFLNALNALKRGKAGVRLPLEWTGVAGKVADAFNEVVELNERMAEELARLSRVGRQGRQAQPARLARRRQRLLAGIGRVGQRSDRRPGASDQRNGARHRRRRPRRPVADHGARNRRPPAARANSCAPPRPSTRWWSSSARSPRK